MKSFLAKRSSFRARIVQQNLVDSCGCAMGARFVAIALVSAAGWYAWHWHSSAISIWAIALRVMVWLFLAAAVGKIVGILIFKSRFRKSSI
jgi:hypothetical protein